MDAATMVVIGAGPGIGRAVSRRFGREGYKIGLVARDADRLNEDVASLASLGVEAASFPADVMDRPRLRRALQDAEKRLGPIDVIEYSPTPPPESLATPQQITIENATFHFELGVLGAITVVNEVLPGMLERQSGGLLFTTAYSAVHPVSFSANFAIAAAGLRNYVQGLHDALLASGIYAGIVEVAGGIDKTDGVTESGAPNPLGMPIIPASEVGDLFWELFTNRDRTEAVVGDPDAIHRLLGQSSG